MFSSYIIFIYPIPCTFHLGISDSAGAPTIYLTPDKQELERGIHASAQLVWMGGSSESLGEQGAGGVGRASLQGSELPVLVTTLSPGSCTVSDT